MGGGLSADQSVDEDVISDEGDWGGRGQVGEENVSFESVGGWRTARRAGSLARAAPAGKECNSGIASLRCGAGTKRAIRDAVEGGG